MLSFQELKTGTTVDNIFVDHHSGDLWLGCQPVGWKIAYHLQHQSSTTSPSQVFICLFINYLNNLRLILMYKLQILNKMFHLNKASQHGKKIP